MKTLIVIDMQNDFITGPLGTPEAVAIVPKVKEKIEEYHENGGRVIFTKDTHFNNYFKTLEGRKLPVIHCMNDTYGWDLVDGLWSKYDSVLYKFAFGYNEWDMNIGMPIGDGIELVGVCTDICVVSNALILKSQFPEIEITVDASCCAGTTPENHKAALQVMKSCQINVINE